MIENLDGEIWKDAVGYEGLYEVSNLGRIKSLIDNHGNSREKIVKPIKNTHGYFTVNLSKDKKQRSVRLHRLIALTFIENPNNFPYINHKDENKTNNRVENLEWCTPKYNVNYGTCREKISNSQKGEKGYWYGKHLPEELLKKRSDAIKGKKLNLSEEERKRRSDMCKSRVGEKNPNYGKKFTLEHRLKISEAQKRRFENINK